MRPGLVSERSGDRFPTGPNLFHSGFLNFEVVNRLKFAYESLFGQLEPIMQISSESMKRRPLADEIEAG